MRVLFVNPPARRPQTEALVMPPLGLAYLAAASRQAGHEVALLDAFGEGLGWAEFASRVAAAGAEVIALTGLTPVFDTVRRALEICRPHARHLLLGGAHATALRETVLADNPELDYAVAGEGEVTLVELLAALAAGRSPAGLPGVIAREGVGPARELIADLDALPLPARDLLPNHRYRHPLCARGPLATVISSRGCPFACRFCDKGVFGSRWRARSAGSVLAEVDELVNRYGVRSLVFYDDLFTLERDRLEAICRGLIERNYALSWKAEGRVDLADAESLALMRRAGCDTLAYGVESANPEGLEYLRKGTTPAQARRAFALTRAAGIRTLGYFILGIPGETYAQARRTVDLAIELRADYAQFSLLSPLPGTELYAQAVAEGQYREIPAHNALDKDLLRPVVLCAEWDERRLIEIIREAHRRFYLRPGYGLQRLLALRSPAELGQCAALGWSLLKYVCGRS